MIKKTFGVGCKRIVVEESVAEMLSDFVPITGAVLRSFAKSKAKEKVQCEPKLSQIFSLTIPPTTFSDIGGVLYGVQAGSIQNRETLTELRQIIRADPRCNLIPDVKWVTRLEQFITFAKQHPGQ